MIEQKSYRISLGLAVALHIGLLIFLMEPIRSQAPTLIQGNEKRPQLTENSKENHHKTISAVSIDHQEVIKTIERIKQERRDRRQAELNRQNVLKQKANLARQKRLNEERQVAKLKAEAAKLKKAQNRRRIEQENKLKYLAQKKIAEEKRLKALKEKQLEVLKRKKQEALKLAELKKQQEKTRKEEAERKAQLEKQRAEKAAARKARIAGEVNKYKALIISAISQQWILPDNVPERVSSQFRIKLAPSGTVLDVSLLRSSGDAVLDRSAQSAIYKASPLPVPSNPDAFNVFRDIHLTVRPENARG